MKKKMVAICILGILMFPARVTWAAAFFCPGKVTTLAIGPSNGILQVNAGYGVHYLCSLSVAMNGIPPEICRSYYSMFLAAKMAGKSINQGYDDNNVVGKSCGTLGNWAVPNPMPYWIELLD